MSVTQEEKAAAFHELHHGPGVFVIPNPWDVGSARILAGLGFRALATSSAASAAAIGRRDRGLTRGEALAHARLIVGATDLPSGKTVLTASSTEVRSDRDRTWRCLTWMRLRSITKSCFKPLSYATSLTATIYVGDGIGDGTRGRRRGDGITPRAQREIVQRAIACNGLQRPWQIWHCRQLGICNLQIRRGG